MLTNNNLNVYLRSNVWNKFVHLVKKDKCEVCGSTENLQVHHIYPFIQMVNDTLVELGLERKHINEYTDLELKNIKEKVMGKHLLYTYQTLCVHCHISGVHKKHKEVEFSIDDEILDKWLTKGTIQEFVITKNNMRNDEGRMLTVNGLTKVITQYGYKIERKKFRDKEQCAKTGKNKRITLYKITKL